MPLSTINKTVALFVVGYLALAVVIVVWWEEVLSLWSAHQEFFGSAGSVGLGVLSIALAALFGAVIDGLTDVTIRRFVKWAAKRRGMALFFGQSEVFQSVEQWKHHFQAQIDQSNGELFRTIGKDHPLFRLHLATGLLHAHAPSHHIEWVFAHFATHYLASNLAFLVLVSTPILALHAVSGSVNPIASVLAAVTAILLAAYGLLSLSMHRCLYTYQAEFRFAAIWLSEAQADKHLNGAKQSVSSA
jgi:hypothetical protein